ncbi:MAG: TatD family hydrolase, partial [Humibacillus sp.]|nr:TatD family hydrolase [Humibacillus sp.]MDN5779512.1 TatD family hydrolase [Humibacillus sp.]
MNLAENRSGRSHAHGRRQKTPFISEVGLDGAASTDAGTQREIFRSILALVARTPRIISVHSKRATSQVLDLIEESVARGVVLHWWLGSQGETKRAIGLGCVFSVNRSMDCAKLRSAGVPLGSLLPETDHPVGNRQGTDRRQPGWTSDVEQAVAEAYGITTVEVRAQFWGTLAGLTQELDLDELFPRAVNAMLVAARSQPGGLGSTVISPERPA